LNHLKLSIAVFFTLLCMLGGMLSQDKDVIDWWQRGCPPHPYLTPGPVAGWLLGGTGLDDQWYHTFYYGEESGRLLGLEGAVGRAEWVPQDLLGHYYDGLGHGYAALVDDPVATVRLIEEHVPEAYQMALHDGVLRHFTMESKGKPSKVVPFAQRYLRISGLKDPFNGVRIGLQRSLGNKLSDALAVAGKYPKVYWPALFEELGWRSAGHRPPRAKNATGPLVDDDAYWAKATEWVRLHADLVPQASVCHYYHGAIRGRGLQYPWQDALGWARIQAEIDALEPGCREAAYVGTAWAIFIHASHKPGHATIMLNSITDKEGRGHAKRAFAAIDLSLAGPEYEPVAPWDIEALLLGTAEGLSEGPPGLSEHSDP
jgi:hypothetical protein